MYIVIYIYMFHPYLYIYCISFHINIILKSQTMSSPYHPPGHLSTSDGDVASSSSTSEELQMEAGNSWTNMEWMDDG